MNKYILITLLTLGLVSCDPKDINRAIDLMSEASQAQKYNIADGLKEALKLAICPDLNSKYLSIAETKKASISSSSPPKLLMT